MANRVEHYEVLEIIDTSIEDTTPFITAANIFVTAHLGESDLAAATLKEIERWVAAHFVAIRDPRSVKDKVGETETQYFTPKAGAGLDGTPYGQQAMLLDTTDTLAGIGTTITPSISTFGVYDDENTDD